MYKIVTDRFLAIEKEKYKKEGKEERERNGLDSKRQILMKLIFSQCLKFLPSQFC